MMSRFLDALETMGDSKRVNAFESVWGPMPQDLHAKERERIILSVMEHPWCIRERDRRTAGALSQTGTTASRVVQEYARIAFSDPRRLVRRVRDIGAEGAEIMTWVELDELDEDTARAISSIKPVPGGGYAVTFWSKLDALGKLAELTNAMVPRDPTKALTVEDVTDDELALMLLELEGAGSTSSGHAPVPQAPEVLDPEEDV